MTLGKPDPQYDRHWLRATCTLEDRETKAVCGKQKVYLKGPDLTLCPRCDAAAITIIQERAS